MEDSNETPIHEKKKKPDGTFDLGNSFWKLRLKHGRDRIIKSPEQLWQNAVEYFEWCDNNPLYSYDYKGGAATKVKIPHKRVYQKDGFAIACGCSSYQSIADLKDISPDFLEVVTRIEQTISLQKYEGATSDLFNARIIAQDLGLNIQRIVVNDQRKTVDELFPSEDEIDGKEVD